MELNRTSINNTTTTITPPSELNVADPEELRSILVCSTNLEEENRSTTSTSTVLPPSPPTAPPPPPPTTTTTTSNNVTNNNVGIAVVEAVLVRGEDEQQQQQIVTAVPVYDHPHNNSNISLVVLDPLVEEKRQLEHKMMVTSSNVAEKQREQVNSNNSMVMPAPSVEEQAAQIRAAGYIAAMRNDEERELDRVGIRNAAFRGVKENAEVRIANEVARRRDREGLDVVHDQRPPPAVADYFYQTQAQVMPTRKEDEKEEDVYKKDPTKKGYDVNEYNTTDYKCEEYKADNYVYKSVYD